LIEYEIIAVPRPQGSKKHVGRGIMVEVSKHVANWRAFARMCAVPAMAGRPVVHKPNALVVEVAFYFDRPKCHFNKKGLKPTAPMYHTKAPDVDKLLRALFDSMTGVVFYDDSQVAVVRACKLYGPIAKTTVVVTQKLQD